MWLGGIFRQIPPDDTSGGIIIKWASLGVSFQVVFMHACLEVGSLCVGIRSTGRAKAIEMCALLRVYRHCWSAREFASK